VQVADTAATCTGECLCSSSPQEIKVQSIANSNVKAKTFFIAELMILIKKLVLFTLEAKARGNNVRAHDLDYFHLRCSIISLFHCFHPPYSAIAA
jgi:hypothetical protein